MLNLKNDLYDESDLLIESTSANTANATPIILNRTDRLKLEFHPVLVNNNKNSAHSLKGKLVFSKKRKNDDIYADEYDDQELVNIII